MRGSRFIKIKNPDCRNAHTMQKNYEGLWRILKLDNIVKHSKGFTITTKKHVYKLRV